MTALTQKHDLTTCAVDCPQFPHMGAVPAFGFQLGVLCEVGAASTLLGAMVFLMSLTYLTNHSDKDTLHHVPKCDEAGLIFATYFASCM